MCAVQTHTVSNDEVIVQYDEPLRAAANEVIRLYPSLRHELESTFKSRITFRPTVILLKERERFKQLVRNDLVVAVAIGRDNLIIIDNSKMKKNPFTLEETLKHELCHLLLHHYTSGSRLPRWLNEGISQWASGGISEMIAAENKDLLKQAALSGRFIPIETLAGRFPADETSLALAYQESRSIVEFIDSEFGSAAILKILNHLKEGEDADDAVRMGLSVTTAELEERWHDYLRKKYTWFMYVSSHLYQILFFLAALVLVYGYIRFLIRKKAYKDEEELPD